MPLPPHLVPTEDALLEGDAPNVLTDRLVLQPGHSPSPSSPSNSASPASPASSNPWATLSSASAARGMTDAREARLPADDEAPTDPAEARNARRRDTSESVNRRRNELPWWKRPSPVWFIPGTLAISLSMGMTIAPKLAIYTQLICRAMDPAKSGVTAPPPVLATDPPPGSHLPAPALPNPPNPRGPGPAVPVNETGSGAGAGAQGEWVLFKWTARAREGEGGGEKVKRSSSFFAPAPVSPLRLSLAGESATPESDQEWQRQCSRSAPVQSEVARLALILSLMMGVLSALTTGFWGALSDRRGRKPVLVLALVGTVLMDSVFLLTVKYHHILSYNFLLVGPFCDGLLGGYTTAQALTSSYLSDVTSPGSRARIFSLLGGLMFGGIALGPVLGSLLISSSPTRDPLVPFYVALGLHASYCALALCFLPESLDKERMRSARERHQQEKDQATETRRLERELGVARPLWRRVAQAAGRPFAFLEPVAMLLPRAPPPLAGEEGEDDEDARTNIEWGAGIEAYRHPEDVWRAKGADKDSDVEGAQGGGLGGRGRDWTLTKIAAAWGGYTMLVAVMSVKLQYANKTFSWTVTEDGYFLSYLGFLRVVTLMVLLPLCIRFVFRRQPAPEPNWTPAEGEEKEKKRWEREKRWLKVVHDSHFDLRLALLSLSLDLLAFTLYTASPTLSTYLHTPHLPLFLLSALLQSLASGAGPALQSLALAHASPRDAGRLFASLSVVQSLASQVVGPLLFGVTFIRTVGAWKEAVFALAVGLCTVSLGAMASVRLRRVWVAPREDAAAHEGREGSERGRDRTVRPCESGISLRTQSGAEGVEGEE
ncbi:hypothetical protein JCM10207_000068 [Rhodosporidiobolus poonsookiae]